MKIGFRVIKEKDSEFLKKVYISSRINEMAMSGWPELEIENFLESQFRMQHKQYMERYPKGSFDIIKYNGHEVGRVYVDYGRDEIRILDIIILPEFQRKGIGGHIIEQIIEEAEQKGIPVTLHVEHTNPIRSYYERIGFEVEKDLGVYLFMKREVEITVQ